MTTTKIDKNNQKNRIAMQTWKMSTAAFLLTAIALISSSALASVHSISVFACSANQQAVVILAVLMRQRH